MFERNRSYRFRYLVLFASLVFLLAFTLYNVYFATRSTEDLTVFYGDITESHMEYYTHGTVFKQADKQVVININEYRLPFAIRSEYTRDINLIDKQVSASIWAKFWMYEGKTLDGQYILYQVETNKGVVFPINNMQNYYGMLAGILFLGFLVPLFLVVGLYYGWIR